MIKIFHVPGTRSVRVIWLCEELGIPYEVEQVSFSREFRMSPEWLAKNPVGKVPAMQDGDLTLFESGAMVQYILDKYGEGRLQPVLNTPEHAKYLQWSWFAEATFARPLGEIVNHRREFSPELPEVVAEMKSRAHMCVAAIDKELANKEYIVDTFSAADIMLGYSMMLVDRLAHTDDYLHAAAYWQRLSERPACQTATKPIP